MLFLDELPNQALPPNKTAGKPARKQRGFAYNAQQADPNFVGTSGMSVGTLHIARNSLVHFEGYQLETQFVQ